MNAATPRASKETLGCAALWSLISCGVLRRVWRLKHTTDKLSQTARSDKSALGGNKGHYKKRPICPVRQVRWTPPAEVRFFWNNFFWETSTDKKAGIRLSSAWASDPQLGLVARCGARAQIHFRGLCHWAGELAVRQAAEPPSRRAAECTSARKSSPPRPHRPHGQFETHPAKWHVHTPPCFAFPLLSSPTHAYAWLFVVARATQFRGRMHSRPTGIG